MVTKQHHGHQLALQHLPCMNPMRQGGQTQLLTQENGYIGYTISGQLMTGGKAEVQSGRCEVQTD